LAGVWAAYNRESAWDKFWVIVSAVALYYAIAGQPRENLWPLAGGLGGISALIGGYFVLTCDWQVQPADVSVINLVGLGWMRIRPTLPGYLHPNLAGGLLAMLMPFSIAFGLRVWRKRQSRLQLYALVVTGITLFSLFMTSSRGAWLALAAGLIVWSAWGLSALASRWSDQPRNLIFVTAMVVLGLIIGLVIWNFPGGLIGLANRLPGLASGTSRWELAVNTYHLALDYPFTGGGLRAFEGLYSRYARIIQVPEFTYSHNFYTDALLEQGLFGLIALASLLIGSLVLLMVYPGRTLPKIKPSLGQLRWATAVSLITLGLHGLVDDALYGNAGTPLLFVWAGLAVATTQPWTWFERPASPTWRPRKLTAGIGLSLLVLLGIFSRSIFASVYANWGAVEMSRAQLMGWPEHTEMDAAAQARFDASTSWFERALQWDAENNAAHYRLGLMAYRRGDFAMARSHLENAYLAWPGHYGVRKVLGYTIGWLGETEQAVILLTTIPEAQSELNTYAWWWATQGRDDLSGYASQMAIHLAEDIKETSTSTRSGP
jgi:tetratricopeptide (TPR) repeat protein